MELQQVLSVIKKDQLIQLVDSENCDLFKGLLSDMSSLIYSFECKVVEIHTNQDGFLIIGIEKCK